MFQISKSASIFKLPLLRIQRVIGLVPHRASTDLNHNCDFELKARNGIWYGQDSPGGILIQFALVSESTNFDQGALSRNLNIGIRANSQIFACIQGRLANAHEDASERFSSGGSERNGLIGSFCKRKSCAWGDRLSANLELKTKRGQRPRGNCGKVGASEGVCGFTGTSTSWISVDNGNEESGCNNKAMHHGCHF